MMLNLRAVVPTSALLIAISISGTEFKRHMRVSR